MDEESLITLIKTFSYPSNRKRPLESDFQGKLIKEIYSIFPGSLVLKTDPRYIQGFPDLLILYKDKWALLECKREEDAVHQPNQDYYVDLLNSMSFSRFVYPENKEAVLRELQQAFKS